MRKVQIIFTHRRLEIKKPISWFNAITRWIQSRNGKAYTRDHVCLYAGPTVYESVIGKGVHKIPYSEWTKGREGTEILIYEYPEYLIDFYKFDKMLGKGYDIRAALFHFFGYEEKLIKRADKKMTCSEVMAVIMDKPKGITDAYKAMPNDIEDYLRYFNTTWDSVDLDIRLENIPLIVKYGK